QRNMQQNYKRLGDYIRLVNVRNGDGSIKELLGININKFFMPSVANVVGTDLSKYKVVSKNQFACNRMHVGRDYRIPIAKSDSPTKFIVSPAYDVFEVIDEHEVLPDYLMLWFKRKEFDRNAWFYTDADVRGGLSWTAFSNIQFPLISISKQKEIIAEYEAVEERIRLNNTLCEKLEETAQTLYRHWFEDFEFPYSRHCEERGTSDEAISLNALPKVAENSAVYKRNNSTSIAVGYKSAGGEMVYSEELGKEIPKGWRVGSLRDLVTTQYGYTATANYENFIHFLRITDIVGRFINWNSVPYCEISQNELEKYELEKDDIIVSRTGANVGYAKVLFSTPRKAVFASFLVRLRVVKKCYQNIVALRVLSDDYKKFVLSISEGSAQPQANANILTKMNIIIPDEQSANRFQEKVERIFLKIENANQQTQKLEELKSLLLGRMAVE
ncbi:MAG: restriction endonuclease subunit S, partial [Weeksellaceae bacterium]|nr:restriction endonuclease subunit S [Weeksellaceae bacterium]